VRRYVGLRKRELGLKGREVFVPQSYNWGQEAQIDWFKAVAKLGGERCKLQFFAQIATAAAAHGRRIAARSAVQLTGSKPRDKSPPLGGPAILQAVPFGACHCTASRIPRLTIGDPQTATANGNPGG
jgi:hypothetical protein